MQASTDGGDDCQCYKVRLCLQIFHSKEIIPQVMNKKGLKRALTNGISEIIAVLVRTQPLLIDELLGVLDSRT